VQQKKGLTQGLGLGREGDHARRIAKQHNRRGSTSIEGCRGRGGSGGCGEKRWLQGKQGSKRDKGLKSAGAQNGAQSIDKKEGINQSKKRRKTVCRQIMKADTKMKRWKVGDGKQASRTGTRLYPDRSAKWGGMNRIGEKKTMCCRRGVIFYVRIRKKKTLTSERHFRELKEKKKALNRKRRDGFLPPSGKRKGERRMYKQAKKDRAPNNRLPGNRKNSWRDVSWCQVSQWGNVADALAIRGVGRGWRGPWGGGGDNNAK